jgi:hypothetical protein
MASDLDTPSVARPQPVLYVAREPKGFCPGSSIVGQLLPQFIHVRVPMIDVKEIPRHLCQNTRAESLFLTCLDDSQATFLRLCSDYGTSTNLFSGFKFFRSKGRIRGICHAGISHFHSGSGRTH